jgi:hypothetical protein
MRAFPSRNGKPRQGSFTCRAGRAYVIGAPHVCCVLTNRGHRRETDVSNACFASYLANHGRSYHRRWDASPCGAGTTLRLGRQYGGPAWLVDHQRATQLGIDIANRCAIAFNLAQCIAFRARSTGPQPVAPALDVSVTGPRDREQRRRLLAYRDRCGRRSPYRVSARFPIQPEQAGRRWRVPGGLHGLLGQRDAHDPRGVAPGLSTHAQPPRLDHARAVVRWALAVKCASLIAPYQLARTRRAQ